MHMPTMKAVNTAKQMTQKQTRRVRARLLACLSKLSIELYA